MHPRIPKLENEDGTTVILVLLVAQPQPLHAVTTRDAIVHRPSRAIEAQEIPIVGVISEEPAYSVIAGVKEEEKGIPSYQEPLLRRPHSGRGE